MIPQSAGLFRCGRIWHVALVDVLGATTQRFTAPCTDGVRLALIRAFNGTGVRDVVLVETELAPDPITEIALDAGLDPWVVPKELFVSLTKAAGPRNSSPRALAGLLARLPTIPLWRNQLFLLERVPAAEQIPLF